MNPRRPILLALVLTLAAIAIGTRISNALLYPTGWGFDAFGNWHYIEQLTRSWSLPSPESGWSAAHPPLFYYLSAGLLRAADIREAEPAFRWLRLLNLLFGVGVAIAAVSVVRRVDPGNARRALLCGGLVLFLPAHIYISAMLTEEMLAALLSSIAIVVVVYSLTRSSESGSRLLHPIAAGAACGLALLTKLSGVATLFAALATYAWEGWRRRATRLALARVALVVITCSTVAGWYYARSWSLYGQLYPQDLAPHQLMHLMPPGERELADYVRVPLETWTDPQLLAPGLLRSVWGSTYATLWFDGHRHFLPRSGSAVSRAGSLLLILALLPTLAFFAGAWQGARRAWRREGAADAPLLLLASLTLAGYIVFTWRNPWYATLKGSYLLMLSVPFGFYASEALERWARRGLLPAAIVWSLLGALAAGVTAVFTYGLVFVKSDPVGLPWRPGF